MSATFHPSENQCRPTYTPIFFGHIPTLVSANLRFPAFVQLYQGKSFLTLHYQVNHLVMQSFNLSQVLQIFALAVEES